MSEKLIIALSGVLHRAQAAANPMTLTGDVADGTASTALDAHLTLGGGITYPVTISGLPAWITNPGSIASGTDVHLTGTYPATANTYNFTVVATDSSTPTAQTASDAQSVVVSAAASGLTLRDAGGDCVNDNSPPTLTQIAVSVTAGDTIVVAYHATGAYLGADVPVCTDTDGNTYTMLTAMPTSDASPKIIVWQATAAHTTTLTVHAKGHWYYGYRAAEVCVTTSAPTTIDVQPVTAIGPTDTWNITATATPPAGSIAMLLTSNDGFVHTASGYVENGATAHTGAGYNVHPTTATLGVQNYSSGATSTGDYVVVLLKP